MPEFLEGEPPVVLTLRVAAADVPALRSLLGDGTTPAPRTQRLRAVLVDSHPPQPRAAVFRLRLQRTTWRLDGMGPRIPAEARLDEGELCADAGRWPISELTLMQLPDLGPAPHAGSASGASGAPGAAGEAGMRAALFEQALRLQAALPLRLCLDRLAAASVAPRARTAPPPAPPPLPGPGCGIEAGYRLVQRHCLAQLHRHAAGVAQGAQAEAVHQLRVGLRRLLTAWRLFERLVPPPPALRAEVDWLFHELGPARDAQVLRDQTLPAVAAAAQAVPGWSAAEDAAAWSVLQQAVAEAAAAAERQAAQAVDSVRCSRLLLDLGAWVEGASWRDVMKGHALRRLAAPLQPEAAGRLLRLQARLLRLGRALPQAGPGQWHRARVVAKKLRYATELLGPMFRPASLARHLAALAALQELLGQRQDACVAAALLREVARGRGSAERVAAYASGCLLTQAAGDRQTLRRTWKRYEATPAPRQRPR